MAFYHCPYIFRTGKICNRGSYRPERSTFIGNLRYVLLVEIDCGKLTSSIHNASDKHIGKYQSKENYHRKKQIKLREKINLLENSTFDIYAQFCNQKIITRAFHPNYYYYGNYKLKSYCMKK